jgi:hypothetical protein
LKTWPKQLLGYLPVKFLCLQVKLSNLKLKTWPTQLLPFNIAFPERCK